MTRQQTPHQPSKIALSVFFTAICQLFAIPSAEAANVAFQFTNTAAGFTPTTAGSWGSVSVSQDSIFANSIDITITLNTYDTASNTHYAFHFTSGTSHPALGFDLSGSPAVTMTFLGSTASYFSQITSGLPYSSAGWGSFPYAVAASGFAKGYNAANPTVMSLRVTPTSGTLTPNSLISNGSAFMTVDIQNSNALTGNVASLSETTTSSPAPAPGTVPLIGLGLAALACLPKKRLSPKN